MSSSLSSQFDAIPAPFGTRPVPEGHVRVNHYTSEESVDDIKRHGLLMSKAHESYARGGTEFPSIFANAGAPSESLLRTRPVVEAHIPVSQLDIGSGRAPEDLEKRQSTVTTNVDVPASNIMAVHHPWHQSYRYLRESGSQMDAEILSGGHDSLLSDPDYGPAIRLRKAELRGT